MISSFYPVVAGRVSDGLARNRALYQIQADQADLQRLQTQLATGYRFQKISESPTAAIRVLGLQREQEFKTQTQSNLKSAQGYLNTTESALSGIQDLANEVRGIAIESATNVQSDSDRDGLVAQLDGLLDRLVSLSNQHARDRYLLTGGEVAQVPLQLSGNVARFHGDDLSLLAIADQQDYIAQNVTSQQALGVVSTAVTGRADLDPAITSSTRLADLNQGFGIGTGAVQFSDGTNAVTVDLAEAETLQDVIDSFQTVTLNGRSLNVTLDAQGLSVNYTDALPGTLRISDAGSGRVAKNLGLATNTANPTLPIVGSDLNPVLRNTTRLSDLNGGAGLDISGGFKIKQGSQTYSLDFTGAVTVEDLLNTIQASGASVIADIAPDGRGLRIRSTESGSDFSVTENTGTLAESLGLRTLHSQVRLVDLNHGLGLELTEGADLTFTRSDGTEFSVDLNSAVTLQDVLDLVNNHVDNQDPDLKLTLSIQNFDNGLSLSATVPPPPTPPDPDPVPITVRSTGGSSAAKGLGLVPFTATSATGSIDGTNYVINGTDPNPQETSGIFNSVLRLRTAIQNQDVAQIGRASAQLDEDIARLSLARGDLGIRQQRIESLLSSGDDQLVELESQESDQRDADLANVLSELSARQAAYEANLRLLSQTTRATIFDFI
jgi:flagellar hook-associated protein 3 FlgL